MKEKFYYLKDSDRLGLIKTFLYICVMKVYEHKVLLELRPMRDYALNRYSEEGWNLVSVSSSLGEFIYTFRKIID